MKPASKRQVQRIFLSPHLGKLRLFLMQSLIAPHSAATLATLHNAPLWGVEAALRGLVDAGFVGSFKPKLKKDAVYVRTDVR